MLVVGEPASRNVPEVLQSPLPALCQRCSKALCHWCQFQQDGVFYFYLLRHRARHGPVYPPVRVPWQPMPPAPARG